MALLLLLGDIGHTNVCNCSTGTPGCHGLFNLRSVIFIVESSPTKHVVHVMETCHVNIVDSLPQSKTSALGL